MQRKERLPTAGLTNVQALALDPLSPLAALPLAPGLVSGPCQGAQPGQTAAGKAAARPAAGAAMPDASHVAGAAAFACAACGCPTHVVAGDGAGEGAAWVVANWPGESV